MRSLKEGRGEDEKREAGDVNSGGENPNICSEIELQLSCVSGAVASENTLNQLLAVL